MDINMVTDIIQTISSIIAIILSVYVYWHGLNRERRLDTVNVLSEIRKKYFNTKSLDDKERLKYLNEMEFFATGVNARIYDLEIVYKMSGSRLIRQYESWAKDLMLIGLTQQTTTSCNRPLYGTVLVR